MHYIDVQLQHGCADCGIFSIAFATTLASRNQPGYYIYNQGEMRQHLENCLSQQSIAPFPIRRIRWILFKNKTQEKHHSLL